MATFTNETFANQEVTVDGNQYDNCTFDNAILLFAGGQPPVFNNCTFRNIKIQLRGAAAQTTSYLGSLRESGLPDPVESVLRQVEGGFLLLPDRPNPPPRINVGENYGRFLTIMGVIVAVLGWIFLIYAFGWIISPTNTLDAGEPLEREISFALIPRLPDSLAQSYDLMRDNQLEELTQMRMLDTAAGVAVIPIEDAIALIVEQGGFPPAPASFSAFTADENADEEAADEEAADEEAADEEAEAVSTEEAADDPAATEEAED